MIRSTTLSFAVILLFACSVQVAFSLDKIVLESNKDRLLSNISEPIRFTFQMLPTVDEDPEFELLKRVLLSAQEFFEKFVSVKASSKEQIFVNKCTLNLDNGRRIDTEVAPSVIENSDLHLIISINNDYYGQFVRSTICSQSKIDGRALVGYITFDTRQLPPITDDSPLTNFEFDRLVKMTIRQIFTILALDHSLFKHFAGSTPDKYGLEEDKEGFVAFTDVLSFAQQHFGCKSISKVNLRFDEEEKKLQWDKNQFFNDLMTSFLYSSEVAWSGVNNALLKDSGWYDIDMSFQDTLFWGKNKGCDFYNKNCSVDPKPREFCDSSNNNDITGFLHDGFNYECSATPNGCSILQPPDDVVRSCQWSERSSDNDSRMQREGSSFYWDSRGFRSSLKPITKAKIPKQRESGCYPQECKVKDDKMQIKIQIGLKNSKAKTVVCTTSGEEISVDGYDGVLVCPNIEEFCELQYTCDSFCSQRGHCIQKQCYCNAGYSGPKCQFGNSNKSITQTSGREVPSPPPPTNPTQPKAQPSSGSSPSGSSSTNSKQNSDTSNPSSTSKSSGSSSSSNPKDSSSGSSSESNQNNTGSSNNTNNKSDQSSKSNSSNSSQQPQTPPPKSNNGNEQSQKENSNSENKDHETKSTSESKNNSAANQQPTTSIPLLLFNIVNFLLTIVLFN